jgi:ribonuclease J
MSLPRREVLIVATGGQGEARRRSRGSRSGEHKIKLTEGDTVVFSSRQIPGNEARHWPHHEQARARRT